ncbi:uncharacterized protein LOC142341411 [Convolutriloba macropyga]|uniref:uncharacterized protein LOC142341411 n=1 Tax=Convolutriloba macropyga TaxID=536237 RepID=UPI003F5210AD
MDSVPPGRLTVMRWITLTWLVVMTTMGVPGNILVIVSLMFMKHLRQLAHLFVANLALFDLGVMFMNSIALIGVIYGDRVMLENPILCDPLKWHQWFSFFKATIHNNSGLSDAQKTTYLQNSVTHKARDSISGNSYNGDYYHEAIAELTRKFGKPQHIVAAYLDQLEKWPKPRLDEPNSFASFSSFLRRLVQTFRLDNFEADLKSSAFLRMARDKLNPYMIIRWNQHTRSQGLLQPNLTPFADWIESYAEACEDISPQRNQRTRMNTFPKRGPPDVSCQLCSQNHNLGRCPEYLEKSVYDQQGCVRRFNLCPNCLRTHEKGLCQSKTRCLVDRCNGFHHSTLHRIPVYATAMEEFRMPRVQIEMLNEICRGHSHLQNIRFPLIRDNRIGILIGADAFTATVPRQFITGTTGTPYGVNTLLGWTLTGPIPQSNTQKKVGHSNSTSITLFNHIRRRQDNPDEDLLQLFWTIEGANFNQCSSKGQSADNKEALSILNDTIKHIGDRYQIGLPWKKDITLPNNYFMAKVQWHALQQRLERDTNLRDRYEETIKKGLDKNYITTADPSCRHSVWYLPHHPVISKQKPEKIRRVTNAASKYKGTSLNDALLAGPDLLCNLYGLLRFRQYSVAITADLEEMIMQIGIQPKDQDYLRFLWTENGKEKIFKYN